TANYKLLTIKKNVTVTIAGTLYGKIDIQEGAQVTFSPVGGIVNIETMTVTGKAGNLTRIKFGSCTSVRVKDNVIIDQWTLVNVDGPKVTFYLGDNNNDSEQFLVKGDNNVIAANVYIQKGSLNVNGNIILMKGWFIAEKVENEGKLVVWNDNKCTSSTDVREFTRTNLSSKEAASQPESPTGLTVTASPNPSSDRFRLQIQSDKTGFVTLKVTDLDGRLIALQPGIDPNSTIQLGSAWRSGVYLVEISQGKEKKMIRLIKL
ncbi:MAG TPA: T9SS type A sorting domain-containing protein, partial [Chitinophagaceae bacterium]|nr:T9SS type A sorting domain-containing protein [Chitinophagaceae bacterium]